MDPRIAFYLRLWKRVKTYRALPEPGGILAQEERLMTILDVIGEEVGRFEKRRSDIEKARREIEVARISGVKGLR